MYTKYIKRSLDFIFSFLGIVLLFVPMLLLALAIRIDTTGCPIFKQKRSGKNRKPFFIWKFRTMPSNAPKYIASIDMERVSWQFTPFQKFLRKTSLDELPQLFNILKGDMSFIGPRPVIFEEKDLLEERGKYGANAIKPGLSGLAQINGRDELDYKEKAHYDGWYVKNISFLLDLKLFFRSFGEIPKGDGFTDNALK